MCARRFLLFVLVLILLAVAAGFAIFQYGGNVLIRQATPKGHFAPAKAGNGPDYSKPESWLARPGMMDDPSQWLPDGVERTAPGKAAIFYIHPTTYLANDRWNAPLDPNDETERTTQLMARSQSSAFNGVGSVWAPRYRQAAFGAFLLKSGDASKALDFAYRDVEAAFDEFLKSIPADQPIVLAGHSQGGLHLLRLLTERARQLRGRLVAAYVVGWPISTRADLPATGLPACGAPDQTGCILSWQSYREPANPGMILEAWEGTKAASGIRRERRDMLCVNPLTGTKDGAGSPDAQAGTLIPSGNFATAGIANGLSAHCRDGLLIIDGGLPALGPYVLPGNNYHAYDYALFWGAIRADADRRLSAWQHR